MSDERKVLDALQLSANTPDHEILISVASKSTVPGILGMVAQALEQAIPKVNGEDPLAAERYVHLADKLSEVAVRLHKLGEDSRAAAQNFQLEETFNE